MSAGGRTTAAEDVVEVPARPVTDGRVTFGALLARFTETAVQTQRALGEQQAILERAAEVARTVVDPEAAAYEVDQVQRETAVQVAEAQSLQAAAERDAREQRRRAEAEAEQRAQADEAAGGPGRPGRSGRSGWSGGGWHPSVDLSGVVDSLSISGHKFLATPEPCGVVLTRRRHRDRVAHAVAYIGGVDATIAGSRSGHTCCSCGGRCAAST